MENCVCPVENLALIQELPKVPDCRVNRDYCFNSSETKRIYFDFKLNYLHSDVEWPIKTVFVIGNLNIYEMQKISKIIMLTNTKAKEMDHKYEVLII